MIQTNNQILTFKQKQTNTINEKCCMHHTCSVMFYISCVLVVFSFVQIEHSIAVYVAHTTTIKYSFHSFWHISFFYAKERIYNQFKTTSMVVFHMFISCISPFLSWFVRCFYLGLFFFNVTQCSFF